LKHDMSFHATPGPLFKTQDTIIMFDLGPWNYSKKSDKKIGFCPYKLCKQDSYSRWSNLRVLILARRFFYALFTSLLSWQLGVSSLHRSVRCPLQSFQESARRRNLCLLDGQRLNKCCAAPDYQRLASCLRFVAGHLLYHQENIWTAKLEVFVYCIPYVCYMFKQIFDASIGF
jgi:hypothetical protein